MSLAGFVLYRLLIAAFLTASAYVLGRRLLTRLTFHSLWEELSVACAIGFGAMGTALLGMGLCGWLYRSAVLALLAGCHVVGWASWRSAARRLRVLRPGEALAVLVAAVIAAPLIWRALYPPVQFDALLYHLPAARDFAVHHRVAPIPWLRFVVFPQLNEVLFAAALLLGDDVTAQLLELAFFALVCFAVLAFARRFQSPGTGPAAVALWIASPVVPFLAASAYVEMAVAAFAMVAVYAFACWRQTRERGWLIVSGLAAGFAAGTKYQGLFFVAAIPAAILLGSLRRAGWKALSVLSVFAASAAVAAGPWYARNWILAGSPVWPFLGRIFGYTFWTKQDVDSMMWSLHDYGAPRTLASLLSLPWRSFPPSAESGVLGALLLLLPLTLIVGFWKARTRALAGLALGYVVFWFFTSQQERFLVPILPALCLLTADAVAGLVTRLSPEARRIVRVACVAALVLLVAAALARPCAWAIAAGSPPRSDAEREAFLASRFPSYRCYAELNARFGSRYTIYAFHDEAMKYYVSGTPLGDWFGIGRYADAPLDASRRLDDWLGRLSADFLLVNEEAIPTRLPKDFEFDSLFTPVCRNGPVTAYRIRHGKMGGGGRE